MQIDASQAFEFAGKLRRADAAKPEQIRQVVQKAMQNIKNDTLDDLRSSTDRGFRRIDLHYETEQSGHVVDARLAPSRGGAGSLANLAFFGTSRGGGGHEFYQYARDEIPRMVSWLERIAGEL